MKFLADEGVDQQIVDRLRQDSHVIWYVAEMAPGIDDDRVLELANREDALLLTADKDFGELIFRQRRIATGVLLIRLAGLSTTSKAAVVSLAINTHAAELPQSFAVITPGITRIRRHFG